MIKKFRMFQVPVLFILCAVFLSSCASLGDQSRPEYSFMVLSLNIPEEFKIENVDIEQKENHRSESDNYVSPYLYNEGIRLLIFKNTNPGDYRIKSIYAKTVSVYSYKKESWRELNLDFKDTDESNVSNNGWITVEPGSVKYAGYLEFITVDKKDERLAAIGKAMNKTPGEVNKAIIYGSLVSTKKAKTNCIFIRLDHPALIGEINSLKREKNVWNTILKRTHEDYNNPKWEALLNNRIAEIDKILAKNTGKGKK